MDKKIMAIVTGMQHSGTTYLNNVINSHPKIMSGFECGILLGDLKNFDYNKPFCEWLKQGKTHFGLPDNYLEKIKTMNYEEVYHYIQKAKGNKKDSNYQYLIKKAPYFTDKTPAYIYQIENIYNKIKNLYIPIFVVLKKYESIYYSWVVKRNISHQVFINNLLLCIESLKFIITNPNANIFVIDYDDLIEKKEEYNKYIMDTISVHHKYIPNIRLFIERYDSKIKNTDKYTNSLSYKNHHINVSEHEYRQLYNHLLNLIKIKL